MSLFDNSNIKKIISVLLASLSIGGATGCKKLDQEMPSDLDNDKLDNEITSNYGMDREQQYDEALAGNGAEISEDIRSEDFETDYIDETEKEEKPE